MTLTFALVFTDLRRRAYMNPFYPQEGARDGGDIYNGASSGQQSQGQMNFQQQLGNLQSVNMEMLDSLLMQDSNQQQHPSASSTPQALLEHQVKINQLQQLQQLQQQIFQQQVRTGCHSAPISITLGARREEGARGLEVVVFVHCG